MNPIEYLQLLKKQKITPNWWCSEEYFRRAELTVEVIGASVRVFDRRQQMFPAVGLGEGIRVKDPEGFWADFVELPGKEFLDYEYIYDPHEFMTMLGGDWAVFRKNSRKFSRRIGEKLEYVWFGARYKAQLEKLMMGWVDKFDEIRDAEVLIDYVLNGDSRKVLLGQESDNLYGLNVWDENFQYINFRYSICSEEPFLAEYLRLLFYQDMDKQNKLVNDGGVLDNSSLKNFKDKMNPLFVRTVKSKKED